MLTSMIMAFGRIYHLDPISVFVPIIKLPFIIQIMFLSIRPSTCYSASGLLLSNRNTENAVDREAQCKEDIQVDTVIKEILENHIRITVCVNTC